MSKILADFRWESKRKLSSLAPYIPMAKTRGFTGQLVKGDTGGKVKTIQEWLSLAGIGVKIDSIFGSATQAAVKQFQWERGFGVTGIVDSNTFNSLTAPMLRALSFRPALGRDEGDQIIECAQSHLREHPREIGGQNRGPWVRLYMEGVDGEMWPWCVGFVGFVYRQAATNMERIARTFSCDQDRAQTSSFSYGVSEATNQKNV